MNRKVILRFTIPSLVVGLAFFAVCLVSIRYMHRLQTNLTNVLSENVGSLQAAQELEIRVRQLRFHTLLYLLDPKAEKLGPVEEDQAYFEQSLETARQVSRTDDEKAQIQAIEQSYKAYKLEQANLRQAPKDEALAEAYKAADAHRVRMVVNPCLELLKINKDKMNHVAEESQRVSHDGFMTMLFLGLAGPLGGMVVGYGLTRGLRRSIYRLSVRVQDMAHHLDRDVGSVSVVADGDLATLETQMKYIVQKVESAAQQLRDQQRSLLRTEQLSQVGQLAAGVAHEIRNPLTGIKMLVEAALRPQATRLLSAEDLRMIHREVKRLERTVQSFLDFARLPEPQKAPCDLRAIISQACELVQVRAAKQEVTIKVASPADPVASWVDASQMTTVLVNLFLNALDVLKPGGLLEARLSAAVDASITLKILDNGPGIPPEIMARIFSPFATNKPHGTGIGLYLSARIMEEHGGAIAASNRPEGGACFTLQLPANSKGGDR
jgi:two-component system, NtrC family, sensor histidine kinase HydH